MNKLGNNFMNDESVNLAYDKWINGATLFEHPLDVKRFYVFVMECVIYIKSILFVRREITWKEIKLDYLRERLERDLADIRETNPLQYEKLVGEIISKFQFLIEYEKMKSA